MRTFVAVAACAAAMAVAPSAQAQISADLAKRCRALMVQANPVTTYGTAVSASRQREYFQECIKRQGKMDGPAPASAPTDRYTPQ